MPSTSARAGANPGSLQPTHTGQLALSPTCNTLIFTVAEAQRHHWDPAQLLSQCPATNCKLDVDVLLFNNNYSIPKILAYLLLVQQDDNEINVANPLSPSKACATLMDQGSKQ